MSLLLTLIHKLADLIPTMPRRLPRLFAPLDVVMHAPEPETSTFVVMLANQDSRYAVCRVDPNLRVVSSVGPLPPATRITAPLNPSGLRHLLEWHPRLDALAAFRAAIPTPASSLLQVL
jgi:hypothetical protein